MNTAPSNYALVTALQEGYRSRADHHRFVAQNRAEPAQKDGGRRTGLAGWVGKWRLGIRREESVT